MPELSKWAARIGAVFYILWGIFHLMAAQAVNGLAGQADGMIRARLQQDAFYLLAFALAAIVIAVLLNWRNDRRGYWLNAVLLAVADIPFVIFVLMPGLIPPWPGLAGPLLWVIAFVLTTIAQLGIGKKHPA
ncbi:hypothetical protein [Mesorhizobium kowhaii]|nr:hypothetical protein [Mesorhizobium kowhaii]